MTGDQKFTVDVQFTFEAPVFDGDPTDLFELADLEEKSVAETILQQFDDSEIQSIKVTAVVGD